MDGHFTYQDFDLLIEPGPPGSYRARVLQSPGGESAPVQFTLPFSPVELENFVLKVGRARRRIRGPGQPEVAPLKDFGGKLYGAVFQDELRDILQRSLSRTRELGVGMRLRLRLTDTPELAELPWEFLYDPRHNRFLAQSRRTPLVRYLDLPDPPHPLGVEGPLRLLVMISNPSDYDPLDVEQEWNALTGALAQPQAEGRVTVERLAANMSALRGLLRREEFHVFHFVGHGFYRPDWGDGVLVMEDRNGRPLEVTGEELGGLLNEYDPTRLAVLNACEGARSGASDPFAGVAQSLIQQGLPAVVAMQFEITDDAAIIFAHELYAAIADGYPLEAALAEARGAIRDEGNLTEWGTPVLYSRAPDGRLFDLTRRARISEVERRAQEEADHQAREEADRKAREYAEQQAPKTRPAPHVRELRTLQVTQRVFAVAFSPDGTRLATGSARRRVRIWKLRTPDKAQVLRVGSVFMDVYAVAFSPDGTRLATSSDVQVARIWDATTGAQQLRVTHGGGCWVFAVAFSPDGTRLATGSGDKTARIWDATTGAQQLRVTHDGEVHAVAFSPDCTRLATGSWDKTARIWDATTGAQQLRVTHDGEVHAVAFSPDGTRLATSSGDKTARIWDATTGAQQLRVTHDGEVHAVAFSPDGTRLATSSGDKTARIWDATTGALQLLVTHDGEVHAVAFSPDGTRLATGSWDKTARIWDITGE